MPALAAMPEAVRVELGAHAEQTWLLFDSLLPAGQLWFSPKDVGRLVNVSERSIRNAFDNADAARRLFGFSFNFDGATDRKMMQMPRWAVVLCLIRRANFTTAELRENIRDLVLSLTPVMLEFFFEEIQARRARAARR